MSETKTTMTTRDALTAIINGNITKDISEWASAELSKLDARNEKRRNTVTKEQAANEALMTEIVNLLTDGAKVASAIASALSTEDRMISTQKASSLCRILVNRGILVCKDTHIKNKGSVKIYSLAE